MTVSFRRRGLSLVEVLIGAFIIGISALPILELIRSSTSALEVTEVEVAARQFGADVLERVAGPRVGPDRGLEALRILMESPISWTELVKKDPTLAKSFPVYALGSLLETADVRVFLVEKESYPHPAIGDGDELSAYRVTVSWTDRHDRRKKVTLARFVDR